jgi:hypothetical protein
VCLQLPDEREILKRRLKAEERKKNASVALTVMDGTSRAGSKTAKGAAAHSAWEGDAAGGNFEPITLVVKNLRSICAAACCCICVLCCGVLGARTIEFPA